MSVLKKSLSRRTLLLGLLTAPSVVSIVRPAMAEQTIRIATEGTYYPWSYKDEKGQLIGFDVEISELLCAQMGVKCDIAAQDWDGIIPGLLSHKFDAIVASMAMDASPAGAGGLH